MKKWFRQKSTLLGIGTILGGVASLLTGQGDTATAIQAIWGGIAIIFLRQGIESVKK